MRKFPAPSISGWGRVARLVWGAALILAGLWIPVLHTRVRTGLLMAGVFALFEAARGWCIMRACGMKTRL